MRAILLPSFEEPPALGDLPAPEVAGDDVLVRVHASSVNPVDAAIAGGMLGSMVEHEFPVVLGRDYAGVVERIGPAVSRYAAGDEVYGFVPHANPAVHDGAWAELIVAPEQGFIAPRPAAVDVEAAGAAPLSGITAILAVDALELSEGDTVLVVGATGGVGSFAVQLAAHAGATVVAPGLPEDEEYLRGLGVSEVLDRTADFVAAVRERHPDGVDAVLDVVSFTPDGFEANATALKPGGRGASTVGAAEGPRRASIMATSTPENLQRLSGLLDTGVLRVPIQQRYGLSEAADALRAVGTTHKHGKLAIQVA